MIRSIFALLTCILLSSCTGLDVIDDVFDKQKTCNVDVNLQNQSSHALTLNMWAAAGSDSHCHGGYETAEKAAVAQPGESVTVHQELSCRVCNTHPVASVYPPGGEKGRPTYSSDSHTIVCTDAECVDQK